MEFQIYSCWAELPCEYAQDVERILTDSFPVEERRSISEIRDNLNGPHLELLAAQNDSHILGLVTVWDLGDFVFLEHFAVDPNHRNRGLGTMILEHVEEYWDKPAVLEVELPLRNMAVRRIHFYERNGYVLNAYPYLMPDLSGRDEAVPLLLMSRPEALSDPAAIEAKLYDIPYADKIRPR